MLNLEDFRHDVQGDGVAPATVTFSVCPANGSGNPGTPCNVVQHPGTLVDFGDTGNSNTVTARPGVTLLRGKTYFVVVEVTGGHVLWVETDSADEDAGKASGWSIGNETHTKLDSESWTTYTEVLHIAINGHEIDRAAPRVSSIERQTPTAFRTNANSLT